MVREFTKYLWRRFFKANHQNALLSLFSTAALVTIRAGILLALLVPFIKKLPPRSN